VPKDVNMVYEMFIKDESGNLVDVPVLISNLRDIDGQYVNEQLDSGSKLVHRFFISETVSGIESQGGFKAGDKTPLYIRYAKSVKLRVQLDSEQNEKIKKPMLYIDYEEYKVSTITSSTTTNLSYFVDYYEDATKSQNTLLAFFIIAHLVVVAMSGVRIYNFI